MQHNYDSIIFDLDGTIFQTDKLVIPAFENTFKKLKEDGYKIETMPSEEEILVVIGLTLDEIWNKLLHKLPIDAHSKANEYLLKYEIEGMKDGYGSLYPDVVDTLIVLKEKGYNLFIASNGLKEYVNAVTKTYNIDYLFTAQYSVCDFDSSNKSELVKKIIINNNVKKGVMVGDRKSDIEAGRSNNLYAIGCSFGFSLTDELINADSIIDKFSNILNIVK